MPVFQSWTFRVEPGRMDEALALFEELKWIGEKLGATSIRIMRPVVGLPGGSRLIVITECESLTAYGKYMDAWRDSKEGWSLVPRIQGKDAPFATLTSVLCEEIA